MSNPTINQSFNVDDIRRIRNEADQRRQHMTWDEITKDIHESAAEGHRILAELRRKRTKQN